MSNTTDEHIYHVDIEWLEGRIGNLRSTGLNDEIHVATPPEFPGGVEGIWSPEHLFTASVSSCFFTSFTAVSEFSKFPFEKLTVRSSGKMSREEGKYVMSEIIIEPELLIADESLEKKAFRLLEKAEEICLITRSIKSKVVLKPVVKIGEKV
jgi:peroxiredoxin-like protein